MLIVIVAGVWVAGNLLTDGNVQIRALAVYNPWDQSRAAYLSKSYYARVSYSDWISATKLPSPWKGVGSWFSQPYQSSLYDPFLNVQVILPNCSVSPSLIGVALSGSRRLLLMRVALVLFRSVRV